MSAVYLDRLMAGVMASLSTIAGATVVWAPTEYPRPAANAAIIAAKLLDGPSTSRLGGESVREAELPTVARVTFTGAGMVRLAASGWYWEVSGASAMLARDAMLAAIAAEPYVAASAAAVGIDALDLTASELGGLHSLSIAGPATVAATSTELAVVQSGEVVSTVEIQAYSTSRYPYQGAADLLSNWMGGLLLPSARRVLDRYAIAMLGPRPTIVDLTSLAGPQWESRAMVRLPFGQITLRAEALEPIESIAFGFEARGDGDPITITAEAELP